MHRSVKSISFPFIFPNYGCMYLSIYLCIYVCMYVCVRARMRMHTPCLRIFLDIYVKSLFLLIPYIRIFLEYLIVTHLVEKNLTSCGAQTFIIILLVFHHWTLSSPVEFIPHPCTLFCLRSALIVSSHLHLRLESSFFLSGFSVTVFNLLIICYMCHTSLAP